jgi:hypothetical protein
MTNTIRNGLAGLALVATAMAASASTTYSGNLGDAGNTALVGSDLGAPTFVDPAFDPAFNVALYSFTVSIGGAVSLVSTGFAGGGVDPYFTLFTGSGNAATFLDSNYTQAYDTGGDFSWTGTLAAGQYEFSLGTFGNLSFAEQDPASYTLGDGFIGIPNVGSLGNGNYAVTLTTPVPEPSQTWLLGLGLAALATRAWRARRSG